MDATLSPVPTDVSVGTNGSVDRKLGFLKVIIERWGLPTALIVVFMLFYAGAFPSPLTETRDLLTVHVRLDHELIQLQRLNCVSLRKLANEDSTPCLTTQRGVQ